jgi:Tfp pilus assembly protein PilF
MSPVSERILRKNRGLAADDQRLLAGGLIVLAALLAYSNCFGGPFVFDDGYVTTGNPTIRHLGTNFDVLFPPKNLPVGGRPILNLSYALNYAISGFGVWSYHAFNLLVHILAGLTLFGIVRRTFRQPVLRERFGPDALPLAAAVALLWIVHPVQTEAVTYISQRAESMMSLFYLLTLYSFIRATEPVVNARLWSVLSIAACLCGMATKEVMATAPLLVLLYDRTFIAGSFREAWRQRRGLYAGLAATWLVLAYSLPSVGQRAVGLDLGVTPWHYALTECVALVHYLFLVVWPHPLILDYGVHIVTNPLDVLPQALLLLVLLAATAWALVRKPVPGFAGACFFLILAPTSSFVPVALSPESEHRLYLLLAALLALGVAGVYLVAGRKCFGAVAVLALVWGALTLLRNEDYRTAVDLWRQTLASAPDNARGHNDYGEFLLVNSQPDEAIPQFQAALQLDPAYPEAQNNWGFALVQLGRPQEAVAHYMEAMRLQPDYDQPHNNYGLVLLAQKRFPEAIAQFRETLRVNPLCSEAENNWGNALLESGDLSGAITHYQQALKLNPDWSDVHVNWGTALEMQGRYAEARAQYDEALRANPDSAAARTCLDQLNAAGK